MTKLTNQELVDLSAGLQSVLNLSGAKFAYAIAKNIKIVSPKVQEIEKSLNPKKEFLEYDKKRADLAESFAEKDEKGNPKIEGERYLIPEARQEEFNTAVEKLKEVNKEVIKAREAQLTAFEESLKEEIEIELHLFPQADLPDNITGRQIEGIMCIIDEVSN